MCAKIRTLPILHHSFQLLECLGLCCFAHMLSLLPIFRTLYIM